MVEYFLYYFDVILNILKCLITNTKNALYKSVKSYLDIIQS